MVKKYKMNFIAFLSLVFIFSSCLILSACNNDLNYKSNYTVKFESFGGTEINDQLVDKGNKITLPDSPKKDGYIFNGWYISNEDFSLETKWDFLQHTVDCDIVLYAEWINENLILINEYQNEKHILLTNIDTKNEELRYQERICSECNSDYNYKYSIWANFHVQKIQVYRNGGFVYIDDPADVVEKSRLKNLKDEAYNNKITADENLSKMKEDMQNFNNKLLFLESEISRLQGLL